MMKHYTLLLLTVLLTGCISNDIPFPIVEARINAFEVEHQTVPARVNAQDRTVSVVVDDAADLSALRITTFDYTEAATLSMPDERYKNKQKFPTESFAGLSQLPLSADTRVDMSSPLDVTLTTYQDYHWTLTATQQIERAVEVDNQVGDVIIDPVNRRVVIYVTPQTDVHAVKVKKFTIGGEHGTVVPDPTDETKYPDGYDFRENPVVYVRHAWEETSSEWRVHVYRAEGPAEVKADVFARTVSATITLSGAGNATVEYKAQKETQWQKAEVKGSICELLHLKPATTYDYRVNTDQYNGTFTTTEATQLPNAGLDDWYQDGKLWIPAAPGDEAFWDTGNKGATTIADSNSHPTDDTWNGKGQAGCLESKYLVLKFAAGNIFTGRYVRTDGTNGVLDFGRPFSAFPTALRFRYKYRGSTINRIGDDDMAHLKGTPDVGSVYIALADWDQPFTIKTRKSERSLLDPKNDEHIIAYSVMETSETTDEYQEYTLPIDYRYTDRTPRYIVVVATSSKYGDYFVGGDTSCMYIDDFELLYE